MESWIASKLVVNGSVVSYIDRVVGFSHGEGIDIDGTISLFTKGFSQDEVFYHVEIVARVTRGFEVHVQDTHDHKLLIVLARGANLSDNGVWKVVYDIKLCSHGWLVFFRGLR
jgi:hypothetical protein